jgi:5-methylcytosine-specific restriction endonuclease McrA
LKRCRDCGEHKPLSEFHRHPDNRDGRAAYCKPCVAKRVRINRKQNPAMYERQKRDSVAYQRARFLENPEPKRQYERARYAREREKYQAKMREQYERHTAKYKINAARRRARLQGVWTAEGDEYAASFALDPCVYCGGPSTGIDHITPLSAGGTHTPDNLAPACRSCNLSKHGKPLLHFLLYRSAPPVCL